MKKYYIYTLDYNGYPFYIGKTINIKDRFRKHKSESKLCRTYKEKYINKILMNNENIEISILDEVEFDNVDFWEIYWISQFKQWNIKLCNLTDGGEGGDNWSNKNHSDKTKEKLRRIRKDYIINNGNYKPSIGSDNGRSKLTDDQVIEMRNLRFNDNISYNKLANKYNISKPTVINIIKRKTWKHI